MSLEKVAEALAFVGQKPEPTERKPHDWCADPGCRICAANWAMLEEVAVKADNGFTVAANQAIADRLKEGWRFSYQARGRERVWVVSVLVETPDCGKFWRTGHHEKLFSAIREVMERLKPTDVILK